MNKYGLHGHFTAKEGKADELASILLKASKVVSKAKGCLLYTISKVSSEPNNVWVTEIWETKEDHDNSLKIEAVRSLISKAIPLIDGVPSGGQQLEILGGFGFGK